jgi:N-acetylmuramoyl-L-alanine amidase
VSTKLFDKLKFYLPTGPKRPRTSTIIVHCADTLATMNTSAADVNVWHTTERGFAAIGYHLFIKRDGTLEGGRALDVIGAHAAGHNLTSVGVCLAGGKKKTPKGAPAEPENNFTPEQWVTLKAVIVGLRAKYPLTQAPGAVKGHRDLPRVAKYCPSFDVKTWLKEAGLA